MEKIQFDYFHGFEAEQYHFYRIPKILFTGECFKSLSCEAKVLYGLMLDRMQLSIKNQWIDEQNRAYIFFTQEEVMEYMNCKSQKATKLFRELDSESGIGLIEKQRLGLGRPNVIYVKNFMTQSAEQSEREENEAESTENTQMFENQISGNLKSEQQEIRESNNQKFENQISGNLKSEQQGIQESNNQKFENQTTGSLKIKQQEIRKSNTQKFENQIPRDLKIKNQEVRKSNGNNTEYNNTDFSNTESINLSVNCSQKAEDVMDRMDEVQIYTNLVKANIEYDIKKQSMSSEDQKYVDEIVELMVETLCIKKDPILIAGAEYPCQLVKSKLLKIDSSHIEYILWSLKKNTTKIRNIKAYLLTCIFNAPSTMHNFYQAEVNHDLYGVGV